MLKSALEFGETTVGDIMTMARDIELLNLEMPNAEIVEAIRHINHSRVPVFSGRQNRVVGTLRVRTFLAEYHRNPKVRLRSLVSAPFYVREDAKIDDLLTVMREKKRHLALVRDEKNEVVGLVTIEDILEELVGEIYDEQDVVDQNFQSLGGNKYLVNTHMLVGNLYERMGLSMAPRNVAGKPLLSLMLETLGRLPEEEESFLFQNLEITAHTIEEKRPTEALLHILDEEELAARLTSTEGEVEA